MRTAGARRGALIAGINMALAGLAAAAATAASAPLSRMDPFPVFPRASNAEALRHWLSRRTSMSARTVALLTSRSAFSLVKANSYDARGEERLVRQEIFNAALAKLIDGRSATLRLRMDCAHSEISLVEARVYAGNSRLGAARVVPPDLWRAQNPDVDLSDFIVLACGGTPAPGADTVRVAASAAATPPLDATQVAGAHWVQIGAFRDSRSAEERWRALRRLMPEETQGLSWRTEIIRAKSLVLHRALVGPFPASLDASAFCVKASRKGYVCIAR